MDNDFKLKLLALYPEFDKVTGPYLRKDGRKHVCLNNSKLPNKHPNKTKTISYPKALVEVRNNRKLLNNETVDHDDNDFTNDSLTNLIVRDRIEHIKLDVMRLDLVEVSCVWCKTKFMYSDKSKHTNKSGPFCSRKCSGQYGANVQNGGTKIDRSQIEKVYYKLDKST